MKQNMEIEMRILLGAGALSVLMLAAAPASAQHGGGGGFGLGGTGDAQAQNLPSTVGIGRQTGNGYFGWRGPEQPVYSGRSAYPGPYWYGRPYQPY